MSSAAAQDAVEKAKEIAARLSAGNYGGGMDPSASSVTPLDVAAAAEEAMASALGGGASTSTKRKRWGVSADEPTTTTTTTTAVVTTLPGLEDAAKRLKATADPIQRRVWVSTSAKPASHFASYFSDVDTTTQPIINQLSTPSLKIKLAGRGSSNEPPPPGMPEEPLHVFIEGPPDVVPKAESMVEDLIRLAEAAPLQQLPGSETTNTAADGGVVADNDTSPSSSAQGYTPAPVAALIHGTTGVGHSLSHYGHSEILEEQIGVPNGVVGYIIGRGGENITSMQARSGCKIQIQKEHEMPPGQTQRVITLTAASKESIDTCRGMIEGMVAERIRTTNSSVSMASAMATPGVVAGVSGGTQEVKLQQALAAGHQLVTVAVPDGDVGLIIGRQGMTIRSIQDRSGANIQIPQQGDADNPSVRTVSITHPHIEGANAARQIIEDLLSTKREQNAMGPQTTIQVSIPDKDVGMCIGRSGCVIREMQNKTNTKIQIPSQPMGDYRIATVSGPANGCEQVKQMIERISLEQSSQSVMSGVAYQQEDQYGGQQYGYGGQEQQGYGQYGYGGQQVAAAGGGQQDYSAEWAAYYAAQAAQQGGGAASGGQQTGAVATASTPSAAAPAPADGQPAADTYYEQFFRYAYYYGEDAARKYYGAWSPPAGTPNPYGVNPAGITQAAAADTASSPAPQAQAAAPQDASAAQAEARETSQRRGVSNLPAWMTKASG